MDHLQMGMLTWMVVAAEWRRSCSACSLSASAASRRAAASRMACHHERSMGFHVLWDTWTLDDTHSLQTCDQIEARKNMKSVCQGHVQGGWIPTHLLAPPA